MPDSSGAWGCSSVGRASHWQCEGQGFESPHLHHVNRHKKGSDVWSSGPFCRVLITSTGVICATRSISDLSPYMRWHGIGIPFGQAQSARDDDCLCLTYSATGVNDKATMPTNGRSSLKIGVLTFHRCINYGSYWQARCLVDGLRARGHDAVLLDHHSR